MAESSQHNGATMEDQTRFDLNTAVAHWRSRLESRESFSPDQLRELEAHVLDGTAEWMTKGLTEKEAFGIASTRLGADDALATEYRKAQPVTLWQTRLFWMLLGSIFVSFVGSLSRFLAGALVLLGYQITGKTFPPPGFRYIDLQQTQNTINIISAILCPFAFYFLVKGLSDWTPTSKIKASYFRSSRKRLAIAFLLAFLAFQQLNMIFYILTVRMQSPESHGFQSWSYFLLTTATSAGFAILAARTAPDRFLVKRA